MELIADFHAHVYFSHETLDQATTLCEQATRSVRYSHGSTALQAGGTTPDVELPIDCPDRAVW